METEKESILFENLAISGKLKRAVKEMGFVEATPVQAESIMPILEGRDLVAQAPTGTGKTCAFGIPLIEGLDNRQEVVLGLVLCPTRELVIQTTEELMRLTKFKPSVRITPIYGGQNIERQIVALKKRPQILVATPGRLMDHMRRRTIRLEHLQFLVLDEADEMLDMGFREDIDEILKSVPEKRQTVLFSATMSREILEITRKYLHDPVRVQITRKEVTVSTVEQKYLEVSKDQKLDVLARLIDVNHFKLSIVFCNTKRMVDELTESLQARGYSAEGLHGDMRQMQRDRVMQRVKRGELEILVATDVAARGIDIEDIEAVFNFDLPTDCEYYVHRIGRTGRANRTGVSYSFVSRREMYKLREIMRYTHAKIKPTRVPNVSEIEEVRTNRVLEELLELIRDGRQLHCAELIEKYLEDAEHEDVTTLDLAAAFLSREIRSEELEKLKDFTAVRSDRQLGSGGHRRILPADRNATRLFLNIGKMDQIRKKNIADLFRDRGRIPARKIRKMELLDKFSFIDVSSDCANKCVKNLNGIRLNGRKLKVEIANGGRQDRGWLSKKQA